MIKCEKCGATVPVESKFCLNCGNKIDSNAPKYFSLEEIARQQQAQENSAFSITPDTPDDDPESYLPPIGAKEHSEIPVGEIDPEYFNHKPLPHIQAADPLELLDSNTPELPPIGFSDQMQIQDLKMPEGTKYYHGSDIIPRHLQFQITSSPLRSPEPARVLWQAQSMKQSIVQYLQSGAESPEHFSVIPEEAHVRRAASLQGSLAVSFQTIFADEYIPEQDKPRPKKVSLEKTVPLPSSKVSLEKTPPPVQETTKVSLEKAPPPVQEVTPPPPPVQIPEFTPPPVEVSASPPPLPPQPPVQDNRFVQASMNEIMAADRRERTVKAFSVFAMILIVLLIGAIIAMVITGYYRFDSASQKFYSGRSAAGMTIREDTSQDEIKWANLNNGGLAAEDEDGNVYYSNTNGCICKLTPDGGKEVIYNGSKTNRYIFYICPFQDRIYFLSSITGSSYSVCSVNKDGKEMKIYSLSDRPAALFVHEGFLYYVSEDTSKVNRVDLKTEAVQTLFSTPASEQINALYIIGKKMYVQCLPEDSLGNTYIVDTGNPSDVTNLNLTYMGKQLVPMSLCFSENKLFIVDSSNYSAGKVYSADMDGSNVTYLGGSNIFKIAAYGDLLYYFYMTGTLEETRQALAAGDLSNMLSLGVMRTDGSGQYDVKAGDILRYSFAGGRFYYIGFSDEVMSMLPDGTDIQTVN